MLTRLAYEMTLTCRSNRIAAKRRSDDGITSQNYHLVCCPHILPLTARSCFPKALSPCSFSTLLLQFLWGASLPRKQPFIGLLAVGRNVLLALRLSNPAFWIRVLLTPKGVNA